MVSGIPGVGTMVPMVPTPGYTTPHGTIPARSPPDGYRFRGVDSPDPSQSSQGLKALFLHWGRLRLPQTPSQSSGPQAGLPPLGVLAGLTFLEGTRRQFSGLAPKGAAQRASSSTLFVSCPLSLRPPIAAQSLRSTDPGSSRIGNRSDPEGSSLHWGGSLPRPLPIVGGLLEPSSSKYSFVAAVPWARPYRAAQGALLLALKDRRHRAHSVPGAPPTQSSPICLASRKREAAI